MHKNYLLIFCLFFFGKTIAQSDSTNSQNDIFYSESEPVKKNINSTSTSANNLNLDKNLMNKLLLNNKPFFLTRNSGSLNYHNVESDEFEYSFIYQLESDDPNELRSVPLNIKQVLYPVKSINDTIIQVKSYSDTYFLSTNNAIEYGEISEFPIEFENHNMEPIVFYFKSIKNKSNINNIVKCYVDSVLDDYNWLNEFVKYDYSNLITQKILENINSFQISDDNFYKEFESSFDVFNFNTNTFKVSLDKLLKQSHFFNNDFKNRLYIKNTNDNINWIYDNFEFVCSNEEARKITDLFDFDRNAIIKLELEYSNNINSCDCRSCDYKNDFIIKSLLITSKVNKQINVKITFD